MKYALMASLLTTTLIAQSAADLEKQIARFAPTDLGADITALPANERQALAHIVRAAQVMDALFLEQVSSIGFSRGPCWPRSWCRAW